MNEDKPIDLEVVYGTDKALKHFTDKQYSWEAEIKAVFENTPVEADKPPQAEPMPIPEPSTEEMLKTKSLQSDEAIEYITERAQKVYSCTINESVINHANSIIDAAKSLQKTTAILEVVQLTGVDFTVINAADHLITYINQAGEYVLAHTNLGMTHAAILVRLAPEDAHNFLLFFNKTQLE